jgi:hypothetical protein
MHNADGNSLHLKIVYMNIRIRILIIVARAEKIFSILVGKLFKIVESVIERDYVISDICSALLTDNNIISMTDSCVYHRFALGD